MAIKNINITKGLGELRVEGEVVSRHREEKEAIEAGLSALDRPDQPASVTYHPAPLHIEADHVEESVAPPEPTPEPEPAPEPDPVPEPDPTPAPDPIAGELLHVQWLTALGNSEEAVGDGGRGVMEWCNWPSVLSVVEGASVGLPAGRGNALAIRSIQNCGHVEFRNLFPVPEPGAEWVIRFCAMNGPGQTDTKMHPHCLWPVGSIEAVTLSITAIGGGDWRPHPRVGDGQFPWGAFAVDPETGRILEVSAGEWIDYEFTMRWVDGNTYIPSAKIYRMDGTLWSEYFRHTDYDLQWGSEEVPVRSVDNIRTPSFGMGQAGSSGAYYYVADARFAVR